MTKEEWNDAVIKGLAEAHPDAGPELNFTNPFELLIATMLSAQCTDRQVNKCTPALFRDHQNAESISRMTPEEIALYIKPCGFYNTKGKTSSLHAGSSSRNTAEKFPATGKHLRHSRG